MPLAAAEANYRLADYTADLIIDKARDDGWGTDDDQVGFDFPKWVANVTSPEVIGSGVIGIMDTERMGTYEDFEKISQSPQKGGIPRDELLWHTGRRMSDSFRRLIVERPANREALADARQAIWGDKTPQWWLKNYGSYFSGSYPMRQGTFSIETGGWQAAADMEELVSRHVNAYLRREGLI